MAHGFKTGGRKAGTPNKRTKAQHLEDRLLENGFDTIDELLKLWNELTAEKKVDLLGKLLPFIYPKKAQNIELTGKDGESLISNPEPLTKEEILRLIPIARGEK